MTLVAWITYALGAAVAAYFLFPMDMIGGLRLFVAVGVVLLIGGLDYYSSRLLKY